MPATLVEKWAIPVGQSRALCEIQVTLDNSYPTGGESIDGVGDGFLSPAVSVSSGGYVGELIPSTQKVRAWYGDNNNASDGPLIEVPATTDLSTVVFTFLTTRAA
jgi:hypothetical protein